MNRFFHRYINAVLCFGLVTVAGEARALGPVDLEVGAKVGVASSPGTGGLLPGSQSMNLPNPLGFGVGARAGLAFLGGLYAGANVMYYVGGSQTISASTAEGSGSISLSDNTLLYGGELGYGVTLLDLLVIRPQVGLGNASFTGSVAGVSNSANYWYLEPGVTALLKLGLLYAGADANVLVFPSLPDSQASFSVHAQVGITL